MRSLGSRRWSRSLRAAVVVGLLGGTMLPAGDALAQNWGGHAHDPQHTNLFAGVSQPPQRVRWSAPVDDSPPLQGDELLVHYASPLITRANTVLVTVRKGSNRFRV